MKRLKVKLYFFEKKGNKPVWIKDIESSAIGIDISDDGSLVAVGVANAGKKGDKLLSESGLIMKNPPSEPSIFYDSSSEKLKKIYEEFIQSF